MKDKLPTSRTTDERLNQLRKAEDAYFEKCPIPKKKVLEVLEFMATLNMTEMGNLIQFSMLKPVEELEDLLLKVPEGNEKAKLFMTACCLMRWENDQNKAKTKAKK